MGGLFRWNVSYVLHTMLITSSCGMLVHRRVTSIDTSIVPFATFISSIKFRNSVGKKTHQFFKLYPWLIYNCKPWQSIHS